VVEEGDPDDLRLGETGLALDDLELSGDLCGGGGGAMDGGQDAGSDLPPVAFPSTTPLLFGYELVNQYPGAPLFSVMDMAWPKGSNFPFALSRNGFILHLFGGMNRSVVLDIMMKTCPCDEGGALGMALHPKFNDATDPKPYVYLWYNHRPYAAGGPSHQRLSRFTYDAVNDKFDPLSEIVLVDQIEAAYVHNGARVRFGADGFLYFTNGDDQRPSVTAQRIDYGLFGGVFRIDVDMQGGAVSHPPPRQPTDAVTQGYFIPNDNPFVGVPDANEEYYALGFRNPYSITFDRMTNTLWAGDVGDTWREEINQVVKGGNYGWQTWEGTKLRNEGGRDAGTISIGTLQPPAYEYPHHELGDLAAIMLGHVYRGAAMPELQGKIIYSDWPTGRLWSLDPATKKRTSLFESNDYSTKPVGFAEDPSGELYIIAWTKIYRLQKAAAPHSVPTKLSQTRIFRDLSTLTTSSSLLPYEIRSSLWSDGASKQRWLYVPPGATAKFVFDADAGTTDTSLPPGSLLVKQFDLPASAQPTGGRSRRLETRVLVVGTNDIYGVSYKWNPEGTDADLVIEGVDERIEDLNPMEARQWHFPSFGECWACHRSENRIIGFRDQQLNYRLANGTNQLQALATAGMFDAASLQYARPPIADPTDTTAPIADRATAYLAANCSGCHHTGAAFLGGDTWNALPGVPLQDRKLLNAPHNNMPMANSFGLWDAPLVTPGNPMRSILRARLNSSDPDLMMPPIGRRRVDPLGSQMIDAWITSLPP
jgi:glucose/arabinose dehydrogenase